MGRCIRYGKLSINDGKLSYEHIPSLLRLIYGGIPLPEQNETIADMLDNIVRMYEQVAVNTIVENTYILIEEESEEELYIILAIIMFWNEKMNLDFVTPLMTAGEPVKELYIEPTMNIKSSTTFSPK